MKQEKRIVAIHLPQFYPFPENDKWWGKGFTEWRNVTMAKPRFRGHYQPHIPSDLGFYDLRLDECRMEQEKLAKAYGVYGFCYYHYWFNGKLIMEKPVEAKLANPKEDLPFMMCWANVSWARNWEGGNNIILMEQKYSMEDDIAHFNYLLPYFKDPRYIRVDKKPIFAIHSTDLIPDVEERIQLWKKMAKANGFELYFCRFEPNEKVGKQYMTSSMDASIEFQPFNMKDYRHKHQWLKLLIRKYITKKEFVSLFSYSSYVNYQCKRDYESNYKVYPSLFPGWDNASRRVNRPFMAFKNSTPALFKKWLSHIYKTFKPYSKDENFVFINAWNEWAEGCHLEPDMKYGLQYLEAIKEVVESNRTDK